jgi:hypothetical protein
MPDIKEILKSGSPSGEITQMLAEALKSNRDSVSQAIDYFAKAPAGEKGHIIEAIELITKNEPRFASACLDFIFSNIDHKAPRVRWEAQRIVANIAREFPEKVVEAIPGIIENTRDKGTVVRWSAASALVAIARANIETQKQLVPFFSEIVKTETNNGVKNIYLKGLKAISGTR